MSSTDPILGARVNVALTVKGIETPMNGVFRALGNKLATDDLARRFKSVLTTLGMDLKDDSIAETPRRVAKMYCEELCYGLNYDNFPKCTVIENKMQYDEIVLVNDIEVRSMCEHHFVPFVGTAYIGYIPNTKIIGLSKFNRIVDFFSRRPQVQERLTEQIAATLNMILETENIAVVIKADHMCTRLRGIKSSSSHTITSKMSGVFKDKPEARAEVLKLAGVR